MKKVHSFGAFPVILFMSVMSTSLSGSPTRTWTGQATPYFSLYTTDQTEGRQEILERLETARRFFAQTGWTQTKPNGHVDILAFGAGNEFDTYRINPGAYAFYQRTRGGDFIIMRSLERENYSVVVHEYTHFIVEHAGLKLPLWLSEGLADLYSTVECRKSQLVIGAVPSRRDSTLDSHRWMDWATLTAVDHRSPYYRQPDKMIVFYAQSWALAHMLALDPAYSSGFSRFLSAVSGGATTQEALSQVYQKTIEQLGRELQDYVSSKRLTAHVIDLDARPGTLETSAVPDAVKQVEIALGEVLSANPQSLDEAKSRLSVLAAKYQDDPRPHAALGFLALTAGAKKEAREHFARAVDAHSNDVEVLFSLAHLRVEAEGPSMEVITLLQQAVAADGSHYAARLELGFVAAKYRRFDLAVAALEKLGAPRPEHAYAVWYTLAYSLVESHQGDRARGYAEQAKRQAGGSDEQEQAANLLRYIEQEAGA